ncbi:hypothetical protein [Mycolicibacterium sp.]|uniref:hypothetical protein n=1 Tax=Mycolicibacterium sp. TaxID=2320850 RepID=UPI0028B0646C|nr:hypothetical protein [Mycolicibacterium sp.]
MTIRSARSTASRLMLAAVCGAGLLYTPLAAAPVALAAPCPGGAIADPITGVCWSQTQGTIGITGTGGVCLPGRLGLCMAALQNSQRPGATLDKNKQSWP